MNEVTRFELPPGTEVIKGKDENGNIVFRWENGAFLRKDLGEMLEDRYADE